MGVVFIQDEGVHGGCGGLHLLAFHAVDDYATSGRWQTDTFLGQ
jgi:hypothetical protein